MPMNASSRPSASRKDSSRSFKIESASCVVIFRGLSAYYWALFKPNLNYCLFGMRLSGFGYVSRIRWSFWIFGIFLLCISAFPALSWDANTIRYAPAIFHKPFLLSDSILLASLLVLQIHYFDRLPSFSHHKGTNRHSCTNMCIRSLLGFPAWASLFFSLLWYMRGVLVGFTWRTLRWRSCLASFWRCGRIGQSVWGCLCRRRFGNSP